MSDMRRFALLIGNDEFGESSGFGKLNCPLRDIAGLHELLGGAETGLFTDIETLDNRVNHAVREHLENVFRQARTQDHILLYYSGHGALDRADRLYLAMRNTDRQRLLSTSLEVALLPRLIADNQCKNVALILDCCHSAAAVNDFLRKGDEQANLRQLHDDCGIHILSASTAYEAALEKEGDEYSLFTKHILTGIRDNLADRDQDGYVSIADLHLYVKDQLARETTHRQRPERNAFEVRGGDFLIAKAMRMRSVAQLRQLEAQLLTRGLELQRRVRTRALEIIDECERQPARQRDYAAPLSLLESWLAGTLATGSFVDEWEQWLATAEEVRPPAIKTTPASTAKPAPTNPKSDFQVMLGDVPLEMIYVPSGTFMMGSPDNEKERSDSEGPQHRVNVPEFWVGKYQVTQAQWQVVMGNNPSSFKGNNHPVENVSWENAEDFCQKLAQMTGKAFRLPSEVEWEYACRAGTTTPFAFGDSLASTQANFNGNYPYGGAVKGPYLKSTAPVGSYAHNAFGLYDMHGNVWEWCQDWFADDYYQQCEKQGTVIDPTGPEKGQSRALRGGSWGLNGRNCRSADRNWLEPGDLNLKFGLRVVVSARTP